MSYIHMHTQKEKSRYSAEVKYHSATGLFLMPYLAGCYWPQLESGKWVGQIFYNFFLLSIIFDHYLFLIYLELEVFGVSPLEASEFLFRYLL